MCRVAVQVLAHAGPLQRIRLACLAPLGSHIHSDSSNTLFLHPLMTGENYYVSTLAGFQRVAEDSMDARWNSSKPRIYTWEPSPRKAALNAG